MHGLANGVEYRFSVVANTDNGAGQGGVHSSSFEINLSRFCH